jgi:hypothetical protein
MDFSKQFRLFALLFSTAIFFGPTPANSAEETKPTWKAGAASVVITPDGPMWMAGYASRTKPSEGKIHDLFAKALVVEDEQGTQLVMITSDLISVPRPLRDWLEGEVKKRYNIPPSGLLMNCSHTHCGPELRTSESSLDGMDAERSKQAQAYVAVLQGKLLDVISRAMKSLAPANISYTHARAGFAMNRRIYIDGGFRNHPNPDGRVDHAVPVLKVTDAKGKLRAVMFGYACHNTTLGIQKMCGDYAGFAQEYLEAQLPGTVALFMEGCGGDQNPYPRSKLELAKQHGRSLANGVLAALDTRAKPKHAYDYANLEYMTPPTKKALLKQAQSSDKYDKRHAQRLLKQLEEKGKIRDSYQAPIQVIQFGNTTTLIALPGETVIDYSFRLKRELNGENKPAVWVAGYSNDVFAYIPSLRVLQEGGYEAGGAMRYMTTAVQPGPFTATVEERIISKVHELNRKLNKK